MKAKDLETLNKIVEMLSDIFIRYTEESNLMREQMKIVSISDFVSTKKKIWLMRVY